MFCADQIGPTGESRLVLWWKERLFSLVFFFFVFLKPVVYWELTIMDVA